MNEVAQIDRGSQGDGRLGGIATLPALLRWRVAQTPYGEAYRHFDRSAGGWISHSWRETDGRIERWRRALDREAVSPGDRIAILMPNGIEHVAMDQAALSRGLVPLASSRPRDAARSAKSDPSVAIRMCLNMMVPDLLRYDWIFRH
jgi:long-chain acyl-CoA synthetase